MINTRYNAYKCYNIAIKKIIKVITMPHLRVMGILNVTPDSFSDGGAYDSLDKAVAHAQQMIQDGANIIDVGGYSTRPGHEPVSLEEELSRVVPVVAALRDLEVQISVDTFRAEVAERALESGAHIINDQWAGKYDPRILDVVAKHQASISLMHNHEEEREYEDVVGSVLQSLEKSVLNAQKQGIRKDRIWVDPGIGFVKSRGEELELMKRLEEIVELGQPVLLGTSRKRFIKDLMGYDAPPSKRDEATAATSLYAINCGVKAVRVHNVKMNRIMADAYMKLRGQM